MLSKCLFLFFPFSPPPPPQPLGYFLQDFFDMMCNQTIHQCWELLFHHAVVSACLGACVEDLL